jgi:hypothetical protein
MIDTIGDTAFIEKIVSAIDVLPLRFHLLNLEFLVQSTRPEQVRRVQCSTFH